MTTVIDYALLAGASYYDTRSEINRIPPPQDWSWYSRVLQDTSTGFEASAFTNGTEIVISFAGTNPNSLLDPDMAANLGLAAGLGSSQLLQAAQYYLQVKANAPAGTTISFTGHSLGGGLASLMAAFFSETAVTFDQAPFLQSALMFTSTDVNGNTILSPSVVQSLRDSLVASGTPVDLLAKLDAYITANNPLNTTPVAADTLASRSGQVINFNTEGEFISSWFLIPASNRIGSQTDIRNSTDGVSGLDLHSQALLTAFLQSNQSAVTSDGGQVQSLSEVTYKLQDLLKMIFDKNLYKFDTDKTDENFLERLVKHEATVIDPATGETDAMVTRFTSDLWKLAQDGGLTLNDGNPANSQLHYVSNALIAFAMQKYYEETGASVGYKKELFTDLAASGEGSGGIRFDMADVSAKFATAFAQGERLDLMQAKGFKQYFQYYLQQSTFTVEERSAIAAMLPSLRDWYVQAGAGGMTATDMQNRGAFMLGGGGEDTLTGGTKADLLVGNAGSDNLNGGAGSDVLLGGIGADTLDGGAGSDSLLGGAGTDSYQFSGSFGLDTVQDGDGQGSLNIGTGTPALTGGKQIADSVWESDDKQYRYTQVEGQLIVSLNTPSSAGLGGTILVKDWASGDLGLALAGTAAAPTPANVLTGDFIKKTNDAGTELQLGTGGVNYVNGGDQLGALDLITGSDGADLIMGLGGDDALLGRAGDDVIEGGDGNDVLEGGLGRDTINGGSGNDLIYGSSDGYLTYPVFTNYGPMGTTDPIVLGLGYNWVWSSTGADADGFQKGTLTTTVGRDTQANDDGNLIDGGAGQDVIYAGTGSDVVHGGGDADDVLGMAGNDLLFGDGGNDRIYGDGPNDATRGSYTPPEQHGNDVLVGGAGNDLLLGQGGDDVLFGGADDDVLYGDDRDETNTPIAFQGNDYLDGGSGADKLYGNGGDDILIGGTGDDTLDGGAGQDTYIYNVGDGIDTIYDTGAENNILRFGAGVNKDNIVLRLGSLMLDLGNGDAVHITNFDQNDVFNSSSVSGFEFSDGSALSTAELLARGFDLDGTAGDDLIIGTNTTDRINGLAGNDELQGGAGDDVLDGGLGDDILFGEAGADQLRGGDGIDHLQGGVGNDVLDGGAGNDALLGEEGNDQLLGGTGADELQGGDGDDVLDGGADDDVLFGQAGNDVLSGGDGADQLAGGSENDTLQGGGGNDVAWGEAGDDVLAGGAGNDTLQGGLGNDVYQFGRGDGEDVVYDNDATVGNIDRVEFAAGISSDEVSAVQQPYTYNLRLEIDGTNDVLTIANHYFSTADQVEEIRFADGTVWTPATLPTLVQGTWDSDWLAGTAGADIFKSGTGNDVMQGGAGNDSYRFFRGDGADFISDYDTTAGNTDKIVFGADIAPSQVRVTRSGSDLLLSVNAMDSVLVSNYFVSDGVSVSSVEQIKFLNDGTVWDVETVKQMALAGTSGNDMLIGYATDDNLVGLSGDDTLQGGAGNDTLDGGAGNDNLQGGAGNDVFVFTRGGGQDTVTDGDSTAGNIDTIQFAADIAPADVKLRRTSFNNLEISVVGDTTVINVPYQFVNGVQSAGAFLHISVQPGVNITGLAQVQQTSLQSASRHAHALAGAGRTQRGGLVAVGFGINGRTKSLLLTDEGRRLSNAVAAAMAPAQ